MIPSTMDVNAGGHVRGRLGAYDDGSDLLG